MKKHSDLARVWRMDSCVILGINDEDTKMNKLQLSRITALLLAGAFGSGSAKTPPGTDCWGGNCHFDKCTMQGGCRYGGCTGGNCVYPECSVGSCVYPDCTGGNCEYGACSGGGCKYTDCTGGSCEYDGCEGGVSTMCPGYNLPFCYSSVGCFAIIVLICCTRD